MPAAKLRWLVNGSHLAHLYRWPKGNLDSRMSMCSTAYSGDNPHPPKTRRRCKYCLKIEGALPPRMRV